MNLLILVKYYYADHFFPEYPIEPQTTIPTDAQPALFFFKNLNNIFISL